MRILIATVTAGGGHLQAAAALEEAWVELRPHDEVQKVDVLDFVSRLYKRFYAETYVKLVEHAPDLWGMVFKKTDNPVLVDKLTDFRRGFVRRTYRNFVRHIRKFKPDVILCPHYLGLEIMGGLKENATEPQAFTVSVVTDFEAHALWMERAVDLYCVAADETKGSLVARGAPPDRVVVTGIPIGAKFSAKLSPRLVRRRNGWRDDMPILLVLSGGFGMGPVSQILGHLEKVQHAVQVVVVTGRNEELRQELAGQDYRHPTDVLGYVSTMNELMAVADIILSKPGGLTISEALAMGKPLLILNPIPGQESANSDFLLEHGLAAKVNRLDDIAYRLDQLLDSKKLKEMSQAAKALGRPEAAQAICHEVVKRVSKLEI